MMAKKRHALTAVLIALAVLVGCTSDPGVADPADEPLGQVLFPTEDFDEQVHVQGERLVQECMASRGFDYTPVEYIEPQDFALHEGTNGWSYGVADTLRGPTEAPADPNQTDVTNLSGSERIAWQQALNQSDSGCREVADGQLAGLYGVSEFGDELAQLSERLDSHPDRIALDEEWTNCLAASGHDFASRDAITSYLVQQVNVQSALDNLNSDPSTEPDQPQGGSGVATPNVNSEAIDEIAFLEIDIATADAACSLELGYDTRIAELDTAIRTDFLAELEGR